MPAEIPGSLPVHQRVADELATQIERGMLQPGERLPSVRRLAIERSLSPTAALQVLRALESRGLVESRPQSGYFVRRRPRRLEEPVMTGFVPVARRVAIAEVAERVHAAAAPVPMATALGAIGPAPVFFQAQRLRRLLAGVAREAAAFVGVAPDEAMHAPLCREIARRYREAGADLAAEELLVTQGATEALALALRAVAGPGDVVAVESPAPVSTLRLIEGLELEAVEIPVHPRDGPSLEALEAALHALPVRVAVFTANVGHPFGVSPGDLRRKLLVALLESRGVAVVEDDAWGELRFEGPRARPLKAFERAGNVLLCGSFSRTLAPGLRVGWIAPGRHRARVAALKSATSGAVPALATQALAACLAQGGYDLHLRHLRRAFALQVLQTSDAVAAHFPPATRVTRPRGGCGVWVELPGAIDTLALHARAVAAGTGFAPGRLFSAGGAHDHALRIDCGQAPSTEREAALAALGRLACEALG